MDDQPKKPKPPKPEHKPPRSRRSRWNRTLSKLRRNRRRLIGFLLLCVVGGIIFYVATKPKEPKTAGRWRSKLRGSATQTSGSETDTATTQVIAKAPETFDGFMETASPSQLIEMLLNLRNQKTDSTPLRFVNVQRRTDIGRLLLTKKLTESQKRFALVDYIEAVIQLDAINTSGNLKADHIREHLIEIRDKYSDHPDDNVGAKASLAYILVPIHDFFEDEDESELKKVADLFDTHAEKIFRHEDTTRRLAKLIIDIFSKSDFSPAHQELARRLMNRMEKEEDPEVLAMARSVREQIYFAESELASLVDRIEGGNSLARDDVQRLFEGLDTNPSSRVEIYKIATEVIAEYDRLGHKNDADALMKWLASINKKNESKEIRQAIANAITEFYKSRKPVGTPQSQDSADPKPKQ